MRLIDTDEMVKALDKALYEACKEQTNIMDALRKQQLVGFAKQILSAAPTVEAIPVEQLLSILPKYDDYIHTKAYRHNETMEDIYSKGHEEGWNACLKAIKEELDYWEKENDTQI